MKTITLLLTALIIASLSACSPDKPIVIPPAKIDCPAPQRPVLQTTKVYDAKVFFNNLADITEYALVLEKSNQCFRDALK